VTRHQVIWLNSGHRVIWQGSGLRINRHDSGHRVIRYRIVWLDSGHWVTRHQRALGHQASGHLACQPGGTASSGKAVGTESPGTGSSLDQQRASTAGSRVNWPNRIIRLDQFIMLGRGIRLRPGRVEASGR
ncbi:unnamed protein product, partial [Staurois parvus]